MRCSWLVLAVLLSGCAKETAPTWRRIAILPLENLAAEPSGAVASGGLRLAIWDSLQAQPALHVALPAHRRDLPELQPALLMEGYVAPGRFQIQLNAKQHSCLGSFADCVPKLIAAVAGQLHVTPRPSPRAESLLLLADPAQSAAALETAAKADSSFSALWLGWSSQAQRADGAPAALAILAQAPLPSMPPYDAARLRLREAELRQDVRARAKALGALAALSPADFELQDRAAREAAAVRDFNAALAIYSRTLALLPSPPLLNQAAYVAAFAGDRETAERYASSASAAAPADPRYLDTRGEVAYFFGHFAAAAQFFEQASDANVTFLNGLDLWKAASAARRGGDAARAKALFTRFIEAQTRAGRQNTLVQQAAWDWFGGADDDALGKLRTAAGSTDRGKALFYLALAALHQRDFAAAQSVRKQMEPNSIEFAFLGCLVDGAPPPPGLQLPAEALTALHRYLHGDNKEAQRLLDAARLKMDPLGEGQWRKLAAILAGGKEERLLPPSPEDWLAFLLR